MQLDTPVVPHAEMAATHTCPETNAALTLTVMALVLFPEMIVNEAGTVH